MRGSLFWVLLEAVPLLLGAEPSYYLWELVALTRRCLFTLCWAVFQGTPYAQGVSLRDSEPQFLEKWRWRGAIVPRKVLHAADCVESRGAGICFKLAVSAGNRTSCRPYRPDPPGFMQVERLPAHQQSCGALGSLWLGPRAYSAIGPFRDEYEGTHCVSGLADRTGTH